MLVGVYTHGKGGISSLHSWKTWGRMLTSLAQIEGCYHRHSSAGACALVSWSIYIKWCWDALERATALGEAHVCLYLWNYLCIFPLFSISGYKCQRPLTLSVELSPFPCITGEHPHHVCLMNMCIIAARYCRNSFMSLQNCQHK
jgi:hypothetical protein